MVLVELSKYFCKHFFSVWGGVGGIQGCVCDGCNVQWGWRKSKIWWQYLPIFVHLFNHMLLEYEHHLWQCWRQKVLLCVVCDETNSLLKVKDIAFPSVIISWRKRCTETLYNACLCVYYLLICIYRDRLHLCGACLLLYTMHNLIAGEWTVFSLINWDTQFWNSCCTYFPVCLV